MSGYLLDSSIVIPFLREQTAGNAGPATRYLRSLPGRVRVHLSIVAYAEILEHAADPIERAAGMLESDQGVADRDFRTRARPMSATSKPHPTKASRPSGGFGMKASRRTNAA